MKFIFKEANITTVKTGEKTKNVRLRRICSSDDTFTKRTTELKTYLNKRGYNLSFLDQEIRRVHNITRTESLTSKDTSQTNQLKRVPLVITYNPALPSVSSIIHKHLNILSSSPRCANVFNAAPLVAFRRSNNLSNLLVSAKLRNPNQSIPNPWLVSMWTQLLDMQLYNRRAH